MIIKLSKKDIDKAKQFAHLRATSSSRSHYKFRGGFKYVDVLSGAMAEIAVFLVLKKKYKSVSPPDFEIYSTKNKSYDADLRTRNKNYHIKSQTAESRSRYGASWLMQRNDPILAAPTDKDYLIFTNTNIEDGEVEIHGEFLIKDLIASGKVGECKLASFGKTKVAFYLEDLKDDKPRTI